MTKKYEKESESDRRKGRKISNKCDEDTGKTNSISNVKTCLFLHHKQTNNSPTSLLHGNCRPNNPAPQLLPSPFPSVLSALFRTACDGPKASQLSINHRSTWRGELQT